MYIMRLVGFVLTLALLVAGVTAVTVTPEVDFAKIDGDRGTFAAVVVNGIKVKKVNLPSAGSQRDRLRTHGARAVITTTLPVASSTAPGNQTTLPSTTASSVSTLPPTIATTAVAVTAPPTTVAPTTAPPTTIASTTTKPPVGVPAGAVVIQPGEDVAAKMRAFGPGTTFYLAAGQHFANKLEPEDGDKIIGARGAILTGQGRAELAFVGAAVGVTVQGLIIEGYVNPPQTGVFNTVGRDWLIADNEVRYNTGGGISFDDGFRVVRNYVHHNQQIGILGQGDYALIEANEIAFNNHEDRFDPNWEAGGTKFVSTIGLVARGNYVHDNHGPGLWTDGNNRGTLYEDNTVSNNQGPGIFHEISFDAVIRNNRVEGNALRRYLGGILVANSSDVEVVGNVVRGNKGGISAIQDDRGAFEVRNLWVHDNAVSWDQGWVGLWVNASGTVWWTDRNNRFAANTYTLGADSTPFYWMGDERTWDEWLAYGHDPQ